MRPELVETWNGLGNTPSLIQTVLLIVAAYNHESFYIINLIFPYLRIFFHLYYSIHSLYGNIFDLFLYYVGAGITTLMSISDGSDHTFFLSKDGKDAVREGKMDGRVFISRQSRHLSL